MMVLLFLSAVPVMAERIRCQAIRDTSLSFHKTERDKIQGDAKTMKIKSHEEFALIDFNVSELKKKRELRGSSST